MSNLLAMPLVLVSIVTGTNEDWIDSLLFVVDDGGGEPAEFPPLDLTGIAFMMEVRHQAPDNEVVLRASTADGKLKVGTPPNVGNLLIQVPHVEMQYLRPGQYAADIIGLDDVDDVRRCVVQIDLEIALGVTRP